MAARPRSGRWVGFAGGRRRRQAREGTPPPPPRSGARATNQHARTPTHTTRPRPHDHQKKQAVQLPLKISQTAAILEVVRYGFFALKELLGTPPYFATWLR